MKLPCLLQPRILKEVIRSVFRGPYTTKFPYLPHKPPESFRGKPELKEEDCVGCGACCEVCPTGAVSYQDLIDKDRGVRKLVLKLDMCIFCGQCQANCITEKGIILTNEFDLATTGRREELKQEIEKELVLCEVCKKPIACRDHIKWSIQKLGPLYVSNTSLITFQQKTIAIVEDLSKQGTEILRSDRFRILCPRCRREAVLSS
jgi:hydrogenase-4 component H